MIGDIDALRHYDVTAFNVNEIRMQLAGRMQETFKESVLSIFDQLSAEYSYYPEMKKNRLHYDGWKSNSAYKLNKKVVIPMNAWDKIFNRFHMDYRIRERLMDIERVLSYFLGKQYDPKVFFNLVDKWDRISSFETDLLSIKFYKKGTMHLSFKNDIALDAFNDYVGRIRNWLPPVAV